MGDKDSEKYLNSSMFGSKKTNAVSSFNNNLDTNLLRYQDEVPWRVSYAFSVGGNSSSVAVRRIIGNGSANER